MAPPSVLEDDIVRLRQQIDERNQLAAQQREEADRLVTDIKASGTDPLTDRDAFRRVDDAYKAANATAEEAAELRRRLDRAYEIAGGGRDGGGREQQPPASMAGRGIGDRWLASQPYQNLKASGRLEQNTPIGALDPVEVATRDEVNMFLAATAGVGTLVPEDQRLSQIVGIPVRTIRLMDLITVGTTDSDTVEWVEETARTDAAAETPPGTPAPEATYTYERRQTNAKDIVHNVPATRNNLADAGQARTLLEGRLMNGVERRLEGQILNGNAVGDNLRGILNTAGIGVVARDTVGGERRLEAIHKGITTVRIALEAEPTAVGIHPSTYQSTVFEKDNDGAYLLAKDVSQSGAKTIWGLPAVISTVFPAGAVVVGQWAEGATLWLRSGVSVSAYDQHTDFAARRLVLLQAMLRAAFAAVQPRAFAQVTGL
jgi:HK97 family phage major capsid protein